MYRGHFHLGGGLLGDLADEAQQAILQVQGDVVPCGDVLVCEQQNLGFQTQRRPGTMHDMAAKLAEKLLVRSMLHLVHYGWVVVPCAHSVLQTTHAQVRLQRKTQLATLHTEGLEACLG